MILDTNAISALVEGDRSLRDRLGNQRHHLPVVVIGEFLFGIAGSSERERLMKALAVLCQAYEILTIGIQSADHYARIRDDLRRAGTPISPNDVWIAALAREHNLPILSADRDFDRVLDVQRVSW